MGRVDLTRPAPWREPPLLGEEGALRRAAPVEDMDGRDVARGAPMGARPPDGEGARKALPWDGLTWEERPVDGLGAE